MTNSLSLSEFLAARPDLKLTAEQLASIAEFENSQKFSTVVSSIKKWRPEEERDEDSPTPVEFLSSVWEIANTMTAMVSPNSDLSRNKVQTQIGFELDGRQVQIRVYETPETPAK